MSEYPVHIIELIMDQPPLHPNDGFMREEIPSLSNIKVDHVALFMCRTREDRFGDTIETFTTSNTPGDVRLLVALHPASRVSSAAFEAMASMIVGQRSQCRFRYDVGSIIGLADFREHRDRKLCPCGSCWV